MKLVRTNMMDMMMCMSMDMCVFRVRKLSH